MTHYKLLIPGQLFRLKKWHDSAIFYNIVTGAYVGITLPTYAILCFFLKQKVSVSLEELTRDYLGFEPEAADLDSMRLLLETLEPLEIISQCSEV